MTYDTYARIEELQKRAEAAEAQVARLRPLLQECADDLAAHIEHYYAKTKDYPSELARYERDMEPVMNARAALGETPADKLDRGGTMYGCVIDG